MQEFSSGIAAVSDYHYGTLREPALHDSQHLACPVRQGDMLTAPLLVIAF
jgi:hypothetical protein